MQKNQELKKENPTIYYMVSPMFRYVGLPACIICPDITSLYFIGLEPKVKQGELCFLC